MQESDSDGFISNLCEFVYTVVVHISADSMFSGQWFRLQKQKFETEEVVLIDSYPKELLRPMSDSCSGSVNPRLQI